MRMSASVWGFFLVAVLGCGDSCVLPPDAVKDPEAVCQPTGARTLCEHGDEFACRWADLVAAGVDSSSIALLVGLPGTASQDEILLVMFPDLVGSTVFSGPSTDASEVTLAIRDPYEPVTVSLPIDWAMTPYDDPTWHLYFLSLHWFETIPPALAGKILIHWNEEFLLEESSSYFVWNDHAVSLRIHSVARMVSAYIAAGEPVAREVLWAGARLITTHLYALATGQCYKAFHNHGVMQDRAILRTILKYPAFVDSDKLWTLVSERLSEQIQASVTSEGVHVENSPGYHFFFANLVQELVDLFRTGGQAVPDTFAGVRPQMSAAMVYLLQPNLTFPQFGDTENDEIRQQILDIVAAYRDNGANDDGLDHLEWVASRGQVGHIPPMLDRVWPQSGYAAFRNNWTDHDNAITGHFTCGKLSDTHYHKDETSISLYGYGQELIVDPGMLSYRADSFTLYSRSGRAHNVLIVDDTDHGSDGEVAITEWGDESTDLAWVRGGHSLYADLGVQFLSRTFAHSKPDLFLVVDHLVSEYPHDLAQHFLLHPSLSVVTQPAPNVVVATSDVPGSPSIVLSALPGVSIETHRGILEEEEIFGWYFPEFSVIEEATEVVFRTAFFGGHRDLPILIHVVAPGGSTDSALESFENSTGELRLSWRAAGVSDEVYIPAPAQLSGPGAR